MMKVEDQSSEFDKCSLVGALAKRPLAVVADTLEASALQHTGSH